MNNTDFLWVEKYRPRKIEDCILPESNKKTFAEFLNKKEIRSCKCTIIKMGPRKPLCYFNFRFGTGCSYFRIEILWMAS